jgi:hypothetical protein
MAGRGPDQPVAAPTAVTGVAPAQPAAVRATSAAATQPESAAVPASAFATSPPSLPPSVEQFYLPAHKAATAAVHDVESREGGTVEVQSRNLLYVPAILGIGRVHFVDQRRDVNEGKDFALLAQAPEGAGVLAWDRVQPLDLAPRDLMDRPEPGAYFDALPESINQAQEIGELKKSLSDHLYHNSSLTLLHSPVLKAYSQPDESEREFRMRLQQAAREERDAEVDEVSARYEKRLGQLQDRLRRAEAALATKEADVTARKRETVVSVGESVVGMFLGRRSTRVASRAMSKHRQTTLAKIKLEEAEANVEALQQDVKELEGELQEQVAAVRDRWEEALVEFEEVPIKPRRTDVQINLFGLAWAPHWQITYQDRGGSARTELVPAY